LRSNVGYLKLYLKSCKNLLKNEVRFWRFLHDFVVRFEVRFMSDIYFFFYGSTRPPICRLRQAGRRRRCAATAMLPLPTLPTLRSRQAAASAAKLATAANAALSPSCRRCRQAGRCPRASFQLLSSSLSSSSLSSSSLPSF
jgi:hypothetical protein